MNDVKEWVESILGTGYQYSAGVWVEAQTQAGERYCVIKSVGGPMPVVDDRYPRYSLILIGARNAMQEGHQLLLAGQSLMDAAMAGALPCGAAHIRISEPMGPGFTTENRAWVQVDLQLTL